MKSRYIINLFGAGALTLLLGQGIVSCTDVNEWDTDPAFDRLFGTRESALAITPDALTALVEWEATPDTKYYIIEASLDSLYDEVPMGADGSLVFGEDGSITKSPYTLTGLTGETTYYLRIKSMADGKESRWVYPEEFKFTTDAEQILATPAEGDVTDEGVRLTWEAGLEVTHVTYSKEDGTGGRRDITDEEKAAGEVQLTGLDPKTTYTIRIYNGDTRRGEIEVTTNAAVMVDSEVVVDASAKTVTFTWGEGIGRLTGYVILEGDVYPKDEEQTALTAEQEAGRTLTLDGLKGNTVYTVAVMRDKTVRALQVFKTWAAIPDDYAQVQVGSVEEWDAALAGTNGKLAVVLTGDVDITNAGTAKIPANVTSLLVWGGDLVTEQKAYTFKTKGLSFAGDMDAVEFYNLNLLANGSTNNYIFDFNNSTASVNTISLTSCLVDETRGVFRLRSNSTGTIHSILVEDCLLRNIGSYGFVAQEGSGIVLGAVTMKKSTYVPLSEKKGKMMIQNKGGNVMALTLDQCTLYGFTYAIFDNQSAGFTLDFTNSLIGASGNKFFQKMDGSVTVNTCTDVYTTSDCKFESGIGETQLELSATDLFEDPASGNFRVKVADYAGFGDPRWNK